MNNRARRESSLSPGMAGSSAEQDARAERSGGVAHNRGEAAKDKNKRISQANLISSSIFPIQYPAQVPNRIKCGQTKTNFIHITGANTMNKIIRPFVLASAFLVAIGVAPPPPLISGINTAHAQTDTTAPTAVFGDVDNGVIGTEQSVLLTFSEAVTDLTASDFSTSAGVTGIRVSDPDSDQTTYTIAFTPSSQAIVLRLAANSVMDTAAIPNEGPVRLVEQALRATDPAMPSLVGTYASIAAGEINTRQMLTFTFSEPVTGLTVDAFTIGGGEVNSITPSSGYHTTYTLTLTPTTTGQVVLRLLANSVTDRDGNTGPGIPATLTTFSLGAPDTTAPTVDFGTIDVGVIGTRQTHTIRFNQIVTGFAATDITATGATVDGVSGSGDTWSINFTPTLTSFTLTLAADSVSDTAATPNTGPATEPAAARSVTGSAVLSADADLATLSITDNNGNPVTPNEAIAPDTLTYTATAPSDTTSVTITVTAADSNAEVDLDSLDTNTENFGFRDEMQSFAIEITAADGTTKKLYRLTITRAVSVDTTAPTATFGTIAAGVVGTQQTVSLTFDEAVTGLEAGDFSGSTEVTVDSVTGSGDIWSITFTPNAAAFTLTLAANSVEDTAATPNTGPETAASVTGSAVDTTAPTATFGTIDVGVIGTAQTVGLTFDEAVTGLTAADITATGATVDSVSGSGDTWTITFTPSETSFTLTLAADSVEDLAGNMGPDDAVSASPDSTAVAEVILSEIARAIADQSISAIAGRVERARTQPSGAGFNFAGQQMSLAGNDNASLSSTLANLMNTHGQALADGTLDMKSLLGNSEFTMPLNTIGGTGSGTTFWGSGDYRNLSGEDDDQTLDWDGDLFSLHLGVDAHITAGVIGGVALSWNKGEIDYTTTAGSGSKKTYDTRMTSISPYFAWSDEYGKVWMTAGYGEGELEREDGTGTTSTNDLSMQTFAIGGNSILLQRGADTLRVKGEITQSSLEVDDAKGTDLPDEVDASRIRLSLESTNSITRDNGARIERKVEVGVRHDGGDGTTGSGIELGLGLRHVSAAGLSVEGKLRGLLGHTGDVNEWGVSGTIKKTAGTDGQGFSFALSPGYGDDASDLQRLWDDGLRDADGNVTGNASTTNDATARARDYTARTRAYSARLDARIGYGVNGFTAPSWLGSGIGLLTPYSALTLSNDSNRYRLGVQWKLGDRFDFDLLGERQDAANADDNKILLKGELRF